MKLKTKFNSPNMHLKTINFISNRKEPKNLIKNISKNLELTLLLKKEKEKSNSTTQTQKNNKINENSKINSQTYLYETFYNHNSEKRNNFKKNSNLFLLSHKLNEKNNRVFFYNENNKEINTINLNSKKSRFSLNDICYNSIINDFCKNNNKYFKHKKNNIDMYHYYDLNQRRIEKIIPNINEYLDNNIKKEFLKTSFKFRKKNCKNFCTSNDLNKHISNYKKYKFKSKNINKIKENIKNDSEEKNNKINLCLFNSINSINKNSHNNSKILFNNKKNKRDFSCKVAQRRKKKKFEYEKMNLDLNNKQKKIRIGLFDYLS